MCKCSFQASPFSRDKKEKKNGMRRAPVFRLVCVLAVWKGGDGVLKRAYTGIKNQIFVQLRTSETGVEILGFQKS